jgi:uncharacterized protein YecE (DUF72 family)
MECHAGTSGFSYDAWKGPFYPGDLPNREMLAFYASRLGTVEINNTFYRMPRAETLEGWAKQVPETFRFVIKCPQSITHRAKLLDTRDAVEHLWTMCVALGTRLGAILFQLPPFLRADLERLRRFLAELPAGIRAAFEFRHASWEDPRVIEALSAARAAWCVNDSEEGTAEPAIPVTADFGYLRLRRPSYTDEDLHAWAERIRAQPWSEVFVFFKHEDEGIAPRLAARFLEAFGAGERPGA